MNFTHNLHMIWYTDKLQAYNTLWLPTLCNNIQYNNHILEFCQGQEVLPGVALRYAAE